MNRYLHRNLRRRRLRPSYRFPHHRPLEQRHGQVSRSHGENGRRHQRPFTISAVLHGERNQAGRVLEGNVIGLEANTLNPLSGRRQHNTCQQEYRPNVGTHQSRRENHRQYIQCVARTPRLNPNTRPHRQDNRNPERDKVADAVRADKTSNRSVQWPAQMAEATASLISMALMVCACNEVNAPDKHLAVVAWVNRRCPAGIEVFCANPI